MKHQHPRISCICITGNRPLILQRAIACFEKQDYPDTELVLSYPEDDLLTKAVIDQIEVSSNIKMIRLERIGEEDPLLSRNMAINAATGKYICIWHHEHWHHVNRISDQYRVLKRSPFKASILMHVLLFDFNSQQTYHSSYQNWQETLLCEKQILLRASYMDIERIDDKPVLHFLSSENVLYHISQTPHLYIYIYYKPSKNNLTAHPGNFHFAPDFSESELMTDINETVQDVINMDHYAFRNT